MINYKKTIIGVLFFMLVFTAALMAQTNLERVTETVTPKFALGIGYPYASYKYNITEHTSMEVRGSYDQDNIQIYGLRGYYYYVKVSEQLPWERFESGGEKVGIIPRLIRPFVGLETDYVYFDTDDITGSGMVAYAFTGVEIELVRRLTLVCDMGVAYIKLQRFRSDADVEGVEYMANIGFNFYIFGI